MTRRIAVALLMGGTVLVLGFAQAQSHSRTDYFDAMDLDHSGGVSLGEFQDWMSYAFVRIDQNGNNVIDAEEALVPKMRGVTRAKHQTNIAAQFARQDINNNGQLSMAELTAPPR